MPAFDDKLDALRYGLTPYAEQRRKSEREGTFTSTRPELPITVEKRYNPHRDATEFRSNIGNALYVSSAISNRESAVSPETEIMHRVARQYAQEYAQQIERQILNQLVQGQSMQLARDYGSRGFTVETLRHARDILLGNDGKKIERNDSTIQSLVAIEHRRIENNGWIAELLDTTNAIWKEGEEMDHCMGNSYMGRIVKGEYIAYHITAPADIKMPKSGFTLGYKKSKGWNFDQIKGKKNSTHYCNDTNLLLFVDYVTNKINGGKVIKEETIRYGGLSATNIWFDECVTS